MSIEGVSNEFEENSGEIKVSNFVSNVLVDNSDSQSSSVIIMGQSTPEQVTEGGTYNILYKQKEVSPDQSALIFKDINSVEDWLRNRTDLVPSIDFDIKPDNVINFTSDGAAFLNTDESGSIIIPEVTSLTDDNLVDGLNISTVNWEDFNIEPEHFINTLPTSSNTNLVFVPGSQNKLENQLEIHAVDTFLNFPNVTILGSPTKFNNSEKKAPKEKEIEKLDSFHLSTANSKLVSQNGYKQFPIVKISKECLIKGKIIGKSNVSMLSSNRENSLLKPQSLVNKTVELTVPTVTDKSDSGSGLLIGKNKTLLRKNPIVHLNGEIGKQGILVVPEKQINKGGSNSLLKVNKKRSLLKSNHIGKDDNMNNTTVISTHPQDLATSLTVVTNTPTPVALVAISTDKSEDITEIIIKTKEGENVYKGKTSDIMKATGCTNVEQSNTANKDSTKTKVVERKNDEVTMNMLLQKLVGVNSEWLGKTDPLSADVKIHCPVVGCSYTTSKCVWLKAHVLQHYSIRPFKCDFPGCSWAFFTSFKLKRHQEIHYKVKEYQCPIRGCDRTFSTIYNVNSHVKLHTRPTSETCTINNCNQAFQTRKSYEKHLREHGIEYAPYTCSKEGCGKKYFTINSLNSHSRIHQHNEEELKCSHCGKMFDQPCRLKAHVNTHIGVKPYKCEYEDCMWAFTTSSKLRRHQRKHTQMRKHECVVCKKSFLRSEHLKNHSLKHFVKKSFVCQIAGCATVFSNQSTMYAHLKKHRTQEGKDNENASTTNSSPMDCCEIVYNTKENLQINQLAHSREMASDTLQDNIQLMSDDNLIALESLQASNSSSAEQSVVNYNSQDYLLAGMSDFVQCIPTIEQEQGEYSEQTAANVITHVIFTEGHNTEDGQVLEESKVLTEVEESIGSARTDLTYEAAVKGKRRESESLSDTADNGGPAGHHTASDVVLSSSAGLLASHDNLEKSLLLQDELSTGDLYSMGGTSQEEVGLLGPAGELQVLLLDPTTRLQHSDFEQSTINLRDLE